MAVTDLPSPLTALVSRMTFGPGRDCSGLRLVHRIRYCSAMGEVESLALTMCGSTWISPAGAISRMRGSTNGVAGMAGAIVTVTGVDGTVTGSR